MHYGRCFRILAVVDDFTCESLALIPDTSLSRVRVARELDALIARHGKPASRISDNGPELTSKAILKWHRRASSRIESFIGRLRDECLNETLFSSLSEARAVLAS